MKDFILLVLGIGLLHTASAVTHSLKYFYTASSEVSNFPEFVVVGMVDGVQMVHYDSNSQRMVPKQDWMNKRTDTQYWERETGNVLGSQQSFKVGINTLKQRFNQSGGTGVHIVQKMYGCEWDDESGVTEGFNQYGYDGEDFVAFDLKTKTWIAPTPQAVITKHKWDRNIGYNENMNNYLTQTCIDWLKKYLDYGKSTLMRTVPPSVSLLQKTPSSPVTCHATGFYPSGVMVVWQKDGQDHHEDVENGEILPNDDGTFQKSTHLTVTPEEWKNNKYQCVVQVTGIKKDFIKVLTESEIQTNWGKTNRGANDPNTVGPAIGVAVALLVVVVAVVGVVIWKKKSKKGFVPASTSDTDSENSGKGAQKT
ncbi:H-2 class I histocompatibility antigen, Q9 alpha chain-like [Salvelinus namaycush]|uniref:H-2 class I histocompatibility antigen, Q9 alpha chain-like n=1 Tax=Salvelinus namaycush TaxID=8040 RepID=A0A8U0PN84_SALNM|nr:H-2 class I histocompatibility antigen, Q9 alpha chain-like [Salvelinus namaycush]